MQATRGALHTITRATPSAWHGTARLLYPRAWVAIRFRVWGLVMSYNIYPCPGTAHLVEPRCLGGDPEIDHLPDAESTEERSDMLPVKNSEKSVP
jgi:hypothetical protein